MQLNPSEISDLLKKRIEGLGVSADLRTQGTVVSVTDGICRVHGLSDVMQGEMLEFPGNTYGLAPTSNVTPSVPLFSVPTNTFPKATWSRRPARFFPFPLVRNLSAAL